MIFEDSIVGKIEIDEPVLIELINSKAIQRLKKISQVGVPDKYYTKGCGFRYSHSLGVLFLLKKLGASLEEQVAGLLHDVSHTAFSHVADWVFGTKENEDFQDKNHLDVLHDSEILSILKKYNFDVKRIANFENFPLLDREIPELCIDRVEYATRDTLFERNKVSFLLDSLVNYNGRVVFNSKEAAKIFGEQYLKCQTEHWGCADTVVRYFVFSKILKIALQNGVIKEEDFRKDDDFILQRLEASEVNEIKRLLKYLQNDDLCIKMDDENPQISTIKKFRYVDPEYVDNGILKRLSNEDKDFKNLIEREKKINERKTNVTLPVDV